MEKNTLIRFLNGQSSEEEKQLVSDWLLDPANEGIIDEWFKQDWAKEANVDVDLPPSIWSKLSVLTDSEESSSNVYSIKRIWRYIAAAVLIGLFIGLGFLIRSSFNPSLPITAQEEKQHRDDVLPPTDAKAVLILADGSKIYLDSTITGKQIQKGNLSIDVSQSGDIKYSGEAEKEETFNTLTIPKGSKPFSLTLSDGTKLWLNAASSITYPTNFSGKERKVDITGELYFEVAKNEKMPFVVQASDVKITVLGTHFNINAYEDRSSKKITLLEGSVILSKSSSSVKLTPGQQAEAGVQKIRVHNDLDLEEIMAWKNGLFNYTGADLKSIMKDIERFYDVEVSYKEEIPYQFVAKISRDVPLSSFLEKLEITGLVHFKIEGKRIIVSK